MEVRKQEGEREKNSYICGLVSKESIKCFIQKAFWERVPVPCAPQKKVRSTLEQSKVLFIYAFEQQNAFLFVAIKNSATLQTRLSKSKIKISSKNL